jgi:hypothetical protein
MATSKKAAQLEWIAGEAELRLRVIRQTVSEYAPWSSPEFMGLRNDDRVNLKLMDSIALQQLPHFIDQLLQQIEWALHSPADETQKLYERLRDRLLAAKSNVERLIGDLRRIASISGKLADEMDFGCCLTAAANLSPWVSMWKRTTFIQRATTCWVPSLARRYSSQSPRKTSRRKAGSCSAGRTLWTTDVQCCFPGLELSLNI